MNKAGEGKYGEAAGYLLPALGALGAEEAAAEEAEAAAQANTFYHGTDVESARNLLSGASLEAGEAAARAKGGGLGFYLAHELGAAYVFGSRAGSAQNSQGTILRYEVSREAAAQLQNAGAVIRPIPYGDGLGNPKCTEFFIPTCAFDLFNGLRDAGHISITPAHW